MQTRNDPPTQRGLSRQQVFQQIRRIVAEQSGVPAEQIEQGDHLIDDLGCDSLDVIEIAMEVEEECGISIPDDSTEDSQTVGEIVDGVLALLTRARGG